MNKVLLIGGNEGAREKLEKLNLKLSPNSRYKLFTLSDLIDSNKLIDIQSAEKLIYLMESKSTDYRRRLLFISDIGRKWHLSYSFRIRAKQILGCHIHPRNFLGVKNFIKQNIYLENINLYVYFMLGLFRVPRSIVIKLLRINFKEYLIAEKVFSSLKPSAVIVFTAGQDNLSFLISMFKQTQGIKYAMVILNWDNTSSKAFISNNFEKIGLWNENQISEGVKFSGTDVRKFMVIGSKVADLSYSKYLGGKNFPKQKTANRLLFLGQQNRCDELTELIKINDFLTANTSSYNKLVYRPNPYGKNGKSIISSGVLVPLGIEVNTDKDIDLREFQGIVCLPTTMLLEVVLSGVPYLVYTPHHSNYLFSPRVTWKYYHFDRVREILQIPVVNNLSDLLESIKLGIPKQTDFQIKSFEQIFPNFTLNYEIRLTEFILRTLYD